MTMSNEQHAGAATPAAAASAKSGTANVIYILFLLGFLLLLTAIAGVVMAYLYRDDGDEITDPHFSFQIRSFWIGLLGIVVGSLLSLVVIGYFILMLWFVWALARIITGMQKLTRGERVDNPAAWGFTA